MACFRVRAGGLVLRPLRSLRPLGPLRDRSRRVQLDLQVGVGEEAGDGFGLGFVPRDALGRVITPRLVTERRRVSQDLLKAHFGSSARATNVLSLLEVHGFIHKPEGTNRWEIYFDKIDDYLRTAAPGQEN